MLSIRGAMVSIVMLLAPLLTGWVVTGTMWAEANATRMQYPKVVGVIQRGKAGSPDAGIVVRYELDSNWRMNQQRGVFVLVPWEDTSQVHTSVTSDAETQSPKDILAALSSSQRQSLRDKQFPLAGAPGQMPKNIKEFLASDPDHPNGQDFAGYSHDDDFEVVILRGRRNGSYEVLSIHPDAPIPGGSVVLVVCHSTQFAHHEMPHLQKLGLPG